MTGSLRYGFSIALTALSAFSAPAEAAPRALAFAAQDGVQEAFAKAVDLFERGRDEEALQALRQVLAMDPNQEQAYALWRSTEMRTWLDILSKGGETELIGRRLMDLAELERRARRNDEAAIRELVAKLQPEADGMERRNTVRQLSSDHGEFAVPFMVRSLADRSNDERRVLMMQSLSEMNTDVVPPLIEALDSSDEFQRRNVALVLGLMGDKRAAPVLAWLASGDPDGSVQAAAKDALERMKVSGDALQLLLQQAEDYAIRRDTVLADYMYSDVVWSWGEKGLVSRPVPREVYNDEMAKRAYYRALQIDPNSPQAIAGLARAYVSQLAKVDTLAGLGVDVAALKEQVERGAVAIQLAGVPALDNALGSALQQGDLEAAGGLARALGGIARQPTENLRRALGARDGLLRSRAALALGNIAMGQQGGATADLIGALGETAGRDVVRLAMVIDADSQRAGAVATALRAKGIDVTIWDRGAHALGTLSRIPGVDLIVVAESLPDITTHQVIDELGREVRTKAAPIVVIAADAEKAGELFGEKVKAVITAADLAKIDEVLTEGLNRDRSEAAEMASAAAKLLGDLGAAGADLGPANNALAAALNGRPDDVSVPAARALGFGGTGEQFPALAQLLADTARSDEARAAAGEAMASILTRGAGRLTPEAAAAVRETITAESTTLPVRKAAARALGAADITPAERAELLRAARVDITGAEG